MRWSSRATSWRASPASVEPRGIDVSFAAMLAREYLRENADSYRQALKNRGAAVDIERFLELDGERRRSIAAVEQLKAQKNAASQEIATLKKNKQDASAQIDAMKCVGDEIKTLDDRLA